jgi:3-phenylpropionate/cinnamic acid dioxygenase small subunit
MSLTLDDHTQIQQLIARYCWLVDEGDGDGWASLWTLDGAFTGIPEPLHGREALRKMPGGFFGISQGKLRHHIANLWVTPGDREGRAQVKAYSVVSDWREGGKLLVFAKVTFTLLHDGDAWKISALHADMM